MADPAQKPDHEEWLHWAQVVIDRLTTCVHVYSKPPHEDVFMPEKARQQRNAQALDLLRRIHTLADQAETPSSSLAEVHDHDEQVIAGLGLLFREVLNRLADFSSDMQKLLKSHWHDKCSGRLADELFRGPAGNEQEGIGSGHPEHGRLPEALSKLLEREQVGDGRPPRENATGEPRRGQDETGRRRANVNSRFLRSAGRVE